MGPFLLKNQLRVRDLKISYRHFGQEHGAKPTYLLLHGYALRAQAFQSLLALLSEKYSIIAIDLPGFGDSEERGFWGYEAYASFVDQFLEALDLSQINLIGHSMGGGIALTTAALFPERVRSVVVINSAGIPMKNGQPSVGDRIYELWKQKFPSPILSAFIFNAVKHIKTLRCELSVPTQHDIRSLLPQIQAPCLLTWGDCDRMLPVEHAYEMAALIPNSKVEIIRGGFHEWALVQPRIFCSVLQEEWMSPY